MSKKLPIFLGIMLVCLAVWILITPTLFVRHFIERLNHIGYDLQLRAYILTHPYNKEESPVAIIDIDDKSLDVEGRWPWSREKLAKLTTELKNQGAAVIAFDMFFSEPQDNIAEVVLSTLQNQNKITPSMTTALKENAALFNEDARFATSLADSESILAFSFLPREETHNHLSKPLLTMTPFEQKNLAIFKAPGYISNIPVLQEATKASGFINIFPDIDGIIRHAPLLMTYKNGVYPALSVQAVLLFLGEKIELITPRYGNTIKLEGIRIGAFTIPTNEYGEALIPFFGKSYTFPYFSASDAMRGKLPKNAIAGKIVFVGTSATGMGDLKATAIQNPFPGVEVQATIANGILQNNFSYIPAWTLGANLVITIMLGLLGAILFPYLGPRSLGLIIVLLPASMLFINNWIWSRTGLILSFVIPVLLIMILALLNILYNYLFETRKREQLKEMFGQYVPAKHIDEMIQSSDSYALHGEDREMSVLFADIRNFTTISEGMSAENLVNMLNTFFTPMTEIIFQHRGTIDKYVGDMIMAFWGAPLNDKYHARHAIESALDMQLKVRELQNTLKENNWPPIHIGIGINSGHMSVGDMGSKFRRNYTVIGDAVNLGSRVESLTKFYGVDIIVTESSFHHQSKFVFRKLDRVAVKGKRAGVEIFEVICRKSQLSEALDNELKAYHQALSNYFEQKWDTALSQLEELHQQYPDRKIFSVYIERINEFKHHPVPEDWDGIYVHQSK